MVCRSLWNKWYGRRCCLVKGGEGAPRQTYDKTSNGLHTFFLYQGYTISFFIMKPTVQILAITVTQRRQVNMGVYRMAKTYIARSDILLALSSISMWYLDRCCFSLWYVYGHKIKTCRFWIIVLWCIFWQIAFPVLDVHSYFFWCDILLATS